jgi:integrase/recombinase XerD
MTSVSSSSDARLIAHSTAIDALFSVPATLARHRGTALLLEREQYLDHLLTKCVDPLYVASVAHYLVYIVQIIGLEEIRIVSLDEIAKAGKIWADLNCPYRVRTPTRVAAYPLMRAAKAWLSFHRKLERPQEMWFEELIRAYSHSLVYNRGLVHRTVETYESKSRTFLKFFSRSNHNLSGISLLDVDAFMQEKVMEEWKAEAIASHCQAIRSFLRFAESRNWCDRGIHQGIKSPRVPRNTGEPKGPTWPQVKKLLRSFKGQKASERRAKAMLMLCAIYGLRASEVIGLQLEDFDWRNETFMVRRAKRGGVQHFPMEYEVGEAILAYLKQDRPRCASRLLFVSLRAPYVAVSTTSLWRAVGPRLRSFGVQLNHVGVHSLRHACATRLLHKGSSLHQIADFLGHKDLKSVSIYARCDVRSLRKVAQFRLEGLK